MQKTIKDQAVNSKYTLISKLEKHLKGEGKVYKSKQESTNQITTLNIMMKNNFQKKNL